MSRLKDGEPCPHPGCLSHVSHPCEGCRRVAARGVVEAWRAQSKIAQAWAAEETRRTLQDNPGSYIIQDEIVIPTYPDPCPNTGRRVVTVAEWNNRPDELIDEYAYWFDPEAAEMGLDPWALIEGIDAHTRDGLYDVLFVKGTYRTTPGEQLIYVRAQHFEALKCAASSSGS